MARVYLSEVGRLIRFVTVLRVAIIRKRFFGDACTCSVRRLALIFEVLLVELVTYDHLDAVLDCYVSLGVILDPLLYLLELLDDLLSHTDNRGLAMARLRRLFLACGDAHVWLHPLDVVLE